MEKIGHLVLGLLLLHVGVLQVADYQVWNAADLTAALGRAPEGDRVLVHLGDYAGNWTVPAGVGVIGEPENLPRMQQPLQGDGTGYLYGNSFERNHGKRGGALFTEASATRLIHNQLFQQQLISHPS